MKTCFSFLPKIRFNFKSQVYPFTIIFAYAAGYKLTFDLPNDARKSPIYFHRRAIYEHVESILDQHGINGRTCIQRFLCEASQYSVLPKNDLFRKIIKIIFT
ncbi:hypothetical protein L9F63_015377 [Diploptera punctata]|uniref:Uncharacterized protein n=1 Tax=Diploptera punctata TaxID=6984 RepID=A0AAD8A5Y9_DIPPU|nr:hypothetical protein L9F63_015377 [Diploptera punctata]